VQQGATFDKGGTGDMISFIRFRSGTKSMPVVQAADRTLKIDAPSSVLAMAS
jgi:hypothetical protein